MKSVLILLAAATALTAFAGVAEARPHRSRMVQVCTMHHHHRVCHMEKRWR